MKPKYIVNNIRIEELDENHDVSKFHSNYEESDTFLKEEALKLQNTGKLNTLLILCNRELIGYYSVCPNDSGLDEKVFEETVQAGAEPEDLKRVVQEEIKRFVISKKYDKPKITVPIFGKIYGVTKIMLRKITTNEPIAVLIGDGCKFPVPQDEIIKEIDKMNIKLKHPMYF